MLVVDNLNTHQKVVDLSHTISAPPMNLNGFRHACSSESSEPPVRANHVEEVTILEFEVSWHRQHRQQRATGASKASEKDAHSRRWVFPATGDRESSGPLARANHARQLRNPRVKPHAREATEIAAGHRREETTRESCRIGTRSVFDPETTKKIRTSAIAACGH